MSPLITHCINNNASLLLTHDRQSAYRALFKAQIPIRTLQEIRQATDRAWVLGDGHFKDKIERQLNRRATPKSRGGDRKSAVYREQAER